eukprot:355775-Chlamydomonas_euryale.AAC.3
MLWYGKEHDLRIIVMDLMGPSVDSLFHSCGDKLSLKTTLMLADQMVGSAACRMARRKINNILHDKVCMSMCARSKCMMHFDASKSIEVHSDALRCETHARKTVYEHVCMNKGMCMKKCA